MTNIVLEVILDGAITRFMFDDRAAAEHEMDALQKEIGKNRWSKNDGDSTTHRIKAPTGTGDVVCDKVLAVRLTDIDEHDRLMAPANQRATDMALDYEVRREKAIRDLSSSSNQATP